MKLLALASILILSGCAESGQKVPGADILRYVDDETGVVCYTNIGPHNRSMSCVQIKEGEVK